FPGTRPRAPCRRPRGLPRARRTRGPRPRSSSGLRSGRTPSSATHLVERVAAEHERLLGLIRVGHLVPTLETRIAVVRMVAGSILELREHQVLLRTAGGDGGDLERRERRAQQRPLLMEVAPDGNLVLFEGALE